MILALTTRSRKAFSSVGPSLHPGDRVPPAAASAPAPPIKAPAPEEDDEDHDDEDRFRAHGKPPFRCFSRRLTVEAVRLQLSGRTGLKSGCFPSWLSLELLLEPCYRDLLV